MHTKFQSQVNQEVCKFWDAKRGGLSMPLDDSIDLLEIPQLSPQLVLLDVTAPDKMIYAYFGEQIASFAGFDLTGSNLLDLFTVADGAKARQFISDVTERPCIGRSVRRYSNAQARTLDVEISYFPCGDNHKVTRLLGAVAALQEYANIDALEGTMESVWIDQELIEI
jgi:hypothetical protein